MSIQPRRKSAPEELRRRAFRLDHLPLRPLTARLLIGSLPDNQTDDDVEALDTPRTRSMCELDPGWILAQSIVRERTGTLALIAERSWWSRVASSGPVAELLGRLWRHSVAVRLAARRLAREAGDPDPDAVARAGQLSGLGYWAVAAVAPEWLVSWWRQEDPNRRLQKERDELGSELVDLGRRLAERWDCDPLVVDAAWLHRDHSGALNSVAAEPARLSLIQQAHRWAEETPWSLSHPNLEVTPSEPRLRILMAEVQARCSAAFVDADVTPHEERMTRQNARLRLQLGALRAVQGRSDRFLHLLADSSVTESPEEWAGRAAMTWCAEPEVNAARVVWHDPESPGPAGCAEAARLQAESSSPSTTDQRPPTLVLPLGPPGALQASIQLWCNPESSSSEHWLAPSTARLAWEVWASLLADRARLERRLQAVVASFRKQVETEEARLRQSKLDALGEFAAGAGHELNNPLAVIVGRAQLLLARTDDPEVTRSLRIILSQAQRTHRILRDLMFVARPPAPRFRSCRPFELLGSVLREFERDCAARGVRLVCELGDSVSATWAVPEVLGHLAEILLRNALQATPASGTIHVRSSQHREELIWSFSNTGKGIVADEAAHLFDPFFCGRQAGRGLGLGLPRAARIVDLAGGQLRWTSTPGHETTFHVHLPLVQPPEHASQTLPPNQALILHGDRLRKS